MSELAPHDKRLGPGAIALIVALGLLIGATFLPWVRSGAVLRNSYQVARSAQRLDLIDGLVGTILFRVWFVVPLLAAGSMLAMVLGARTVALVAATMTLLFVTAAALTVLGSDLDAAVGPALSLSSGVLVGLGMASYAVQKH